MSKPLLFSHYGHNAKGIKIFRSIVAAIIFLCVIWGCLIIKIVLDISNDNDETINHPRGLIARPEIHRFGNSLRRGIKKMELGIERKSPKLEVNQMDSPVLIFTFQRANYLERTLWKLYQHHPAQRAQHGSNLGRIIGAPIIISQDGNDSGVKAVIDAYRDAFEINLGIPLYRLEHMQPPPDDNTEEKNFWDSDSKPYKDLAIHYGWALEQTFSGAAYELDTRHDRRFSKPPLPKRVVIIEEDIEVGLDFFSLMNATADLLDEDKTLLAVSGYNDNGKAQVVGDSKRLVRSDFFPGLGWMMPRRVWDGEETHPNAALKLDWAPNGYWDDWLREPNIRCGRQILRPEMSRSYHFGNMHGVTQNGINNQILLDRVDVQWEKEDLSYLKPEWFAESYWRRVSNAKFVSTAADAKFYIAHSDVRIVYTSFAEFESLAVDFDIKSDEKAGMVRTGYEGIVEVRYAKGEYIIFITPPYVNKGIPPPTFGKKAWMKLDKTELVELFGLKTGSELDWPY